MVLPIVAYGSPVLRRKTEAITLDYPSLDLLIKNMWKTMYGANGVGLAAPQVNKGIRLFIVDTTPFVDEESEDPIEPIKRVFINPIILEKEGKKILFNEGCLSIPNIREDIERESIVTLEYFDEEFKKHKEKFDGIASRVIQHEYDHIEGVLFTDKLSLLKKRMIKGKLNDISRGKIDVNYQMIFPKSKR